MPQPICFMIMPFGTKNTQPSAGSPAGRWPAKINFDALWEKVFAPAIEALGYKPVRADQDLGALIIQEMLERLYFSDLVLADMTLPNGNVYYEVGIRHATKAKGCVLLAANWSEALFDVNQMRRVAYPLPEGTITDETAQAIRQVLEKAVPALAEGDSPMFQTLPGFPSNVDQSRASSIQDRLRELSRFQAAVRAVRAAPKSECKARALALRDQYPATPATIPAVALEILYLLRDCADWKTTLEYIDALPPALRELPLIREQQCLAQSKAGDHLTAIGALEELIRMSGATSEREGLIGGRYKKLYTDAPNPADKARYLHRAIEHYERGMRLDLNDYYPSCNLPRLLRERGLEGDEEQAQAAAHVARIACERARERNPADPWIKPTLLGAAFDAGDVHAAQQLLEEISKGDIASWMHETTLADLERSVNLIQDSEQQAGLREVLERLRTMC